MSVPPEQFSRIAGRVDLTLLNGSRVVVIGVGTVGSQIAEELANSGVGRLRLIDGDTLEIVNLPRHILPREYVGWNKAEAVAVYLAQEIPSLEAEALGRNIEESLSAKDLDSVVGDSDLIIAATGDDVIQQQVASRALALDIPAVLPALFGSEGGEVFLQRSPMSPCYLCWDAARPSSEPLRGVTALNVDSWGVIQLAVHICVAVLDPGSPYEELLQAPPGDPRARQLFVQNRFGLAIRAVDRRPGCPACAVGPADGSWASAGSPPSRPQATPTPAPSWRGVSPGRIAVWTLFVVGSIAMLIALMASGRGAPDETMAHTGEVLRLELPPRARRPEGLGSCRSVGAENVGAIKALACEGHGAAVKIEYFNSWNGAPNAFRALAESLHKGSWLGNSCPYEAPATERMYYYDREHEYGGRVLCYWSDGVAVYAWTMPTEQRLTFAAFHSGNFQEGRRWFEKYSGVLVCDPLCNY